MVNSWFLYRIDFDNCEIPRKEQLNSLQFKADIAKHTVCDWQSCRTEKKRANQATHPYNTRANKTIKEKAAEKPTVDSKRDDSGKKVKVQIFQIYCVPKMFFT